MSSQAPAINAAPPPPQAPTASEFTRALELAGLVARAPLRRKRLAALVLALGLVATALAAAFAPRVYSVDTKILAQRNLVMPSLGNPRRSVPSDSDAPTRAAAESILRRDNLVAITREANLVERWDRERPPILHLKDQAVRAVKGPLSPEDKERAIVEVLEKKLWVMADDATIRIALEWSDPNTAFDIVSLAERNYFADRSAVEVAVIVDTIGILTVEADRQREAVDQAFSRVVELRREALEAPEPTSAPAAAPPAPAPRTRVVVTTPKPAPSAAVIDTKIAARLDEKRRAIRAIEEPRQQRIAELTAQRSRLLLTYTEQHPSVLQVDAELKAARAEPSALAELRAEEQALVAALADAGSPAPLPRPVQRRITVTPAPSQTPGGSETLQLQREEEPDLTNAKAKLAVATRKYEDLMDRIDSARIELQTAQAAFKYRYVVVDPPEIPQKATRPAPLLLLLGGLVLSTVLALFVTAAKDLAGGRFVEAWQVRRKLSLPVLAEIDAVR